VPEPSAAAVALLTVQPVRRQLSRPQAPALPAGCSSTSAGAPKSPLPCLPPPSAPAQTPTPPAAAACPHPGLVESFAEAPPRSAVIPLGRGSRADGPRSPPASSPARMPRGSWLCVTVSRPIMEGAWRRRPPPNRVGDEVAADALGICTTRSGWRSSGGRMRRLGGGLPCRRWFEEPRGAGGRREGSGAQGHAHRRRSISIPWNHGRPALQYRCAMGQSALAQARYGEGRCSKPSRAA
jgi:hypothetical protein